MADKNQDLDLTTVAEAYEDWEEKEESRREAAIRNRAQFEGLQVDPDIDWPFANSWDCGLAGWWWGSC